MEMDVNRAVLAFAMAQHYHRSLPAARALTHLNFPPRDVPEAGHGALIGGLQKIGLWALRRRGFRRPPSGALVQGVRADISSLTA